MSLYRPGKSPFYHYDFWVDGRRFLGSTKKKSRRDAQAVEDARREQAKIEIAAARHAEAQFKGRAPLVLDVAAGRWWIERGQHRADSDDCWQAIVGMLAFFGKDKQLGDITDSDVARWVATVRGQTVWGKKKLKDGRNAPTLSPARVNRLTVDALRRIYGRARRSWKMVYANEPDWGEHRLPEPDERVRELSMEEQRAIDASARPGYGHLYRFARLSALRLETCLIPKSAVRWDLGCIEIKGKGGKFNRVPMSEPIRDVLAEVWDDHPDWVFTYIAEVTRDGRVAGKRYPITTSGLSTEWKRTRLRAAKTVPTVLTFRFHDNRHTAATRILRSSKNLKIAQRLLNHARISTTAKYAHVLDDEVLRAMNEVPDGEIKRANPKRKRS